jgi:1-acyl-sn-glycerol-3-phosphate acyltransferase
MTVFHLIIPWFLQRTSLPFVRLYLRYVFHLKHEGLEHVKKIPRNRPVVFAVNHASALDPIAVTVVVSFWSRFVPMYFVARPKKGYSIDSFFLRPFYGGFFFELWGGLPTFPGNSDYEASLKTHIKLLTKGKPVMIFPEGGVRKVGETKEPRGGVAFLAQRTNALIVPVRVKGLDNLRYNEVLSEIFRRKRHCTVVFGKPIEPSSFEGDETDPATFYKSNAKKILEVIYSL